MSLLSLSILVFPARTYQRLIFLLSVIIRHLIVFFILIYSYIINFNFILISFLYIFI